MMKPTTFALVLSLAFALAAQAEETPAAEENVQAAAPPPPPAFELKNKSSFATEQVARNPFWPIGFVPTTRSESVERVGPEIPVTAFNVSSITMDPVTRLAIINGKIMAEGQQFGLQLGSQTYHLTVKAIKDGQVVLLRRDQEIVVPLTRK